MKKLILILPVLLALLVVQPCRSFAAEEEGFIGRMMRRMRRKEETKAPRRIPIAPSVDEEKKEEPLVPKSVKRAPTPAPVKDIEDAREEVEELKEDLSGSEGVIVEMTKEELIEDIEDSIDAYPEILDVVRTLKRNTDENGDVYYTYEVEKGVLKKIEDLDKDVFSDLIKSVRNEWSKLNVERIMNQLEIIRRTQGVAPPTLPPSPPPSPPKIPSIPRMHMPPRLPSGPPTSSLPVMPPTMPPKPAPAPISVPQQRR